VHSLDDKSLAQKKHSVQRRCDFKQHMGHKFISHDLGDRDSIAYFFKQVSSRRIQQSQKLDPDYDVSSNILRDE
jgi:hypothetical protein